MPPDVRDAIREFIEALSLMDQRGELTDDMRAHSIEVLEETFARYQEVSIPQGAEIVWELAGGNPETFTRFLQTVPDEELNNIAQDQFRLNRVIETLTAHRPPDEEIEEGLYGFEKNAQYPSSNIFDFRYSPRDKRLFVKFQGNKGLGEGPVYEYEGVPPKIYKLFKAGAISARTTGQNKWGRWWKHKNPSLGASHFNLIRDKYDYKRVA